MCCGVNIMTGWAANVVILILGLATCRARIPKGYILQVNPVCGDDPTDDAVVTVISDLRVAALGLCSNDSQVSFLNLDGVTHRLNVSYPGQGTSNCVFEKRINSAVYVIKVFVSWGELGKPVHQEQEEFYVTCTFDEHGKQKTQTQKVDESLVAPVEIQSHQGEPAVSTFNLKMINVIGESLDDKSVGLGKIVCLHASSDGASGEQGIRPVGCDAMGSLTGRRYAVLRAGCGDGVVFDKNEGFITMGREAVSPYFSAFDMAGEPSIQFECNFTLCNETCDGSSCDSEMRDKRSEHRDGEAYKRVHTLYLNDPDEEQELPVEDSPNDLVFWSALLGICALSLLAVCLSVCVYARRSQTSSVMVA